MQPAAELTVRTEGRALRPFTTLYGYLSEAMLSLDGSDNWSNADAITLPTDPHFQASPILQLAPIPPGYLDNTPFRAADLRLVITVENKRFRLREVLGDFSWPLDDAPNGPLPISRELRDVTGGDLEGTTLIAGVVVRESNLGARPGLPKYAGSWLELKEFTFRSEREFTVLPPKRATPDDWRSMGLPQDTPFFVEVPNPGNLGVELDKDDYPVIVYIGAGVFDAVASHPRSPASASFNRIVYSSVAATILFRGFTSIGPDGNVNPKSPIATILKRVEKDSKVSAHELRQMALDGDVARLTAVVQASASVSDSFEKWAKE